MGQFSRVNRNKDLYQNIIENDNTEIVDASLRDYERRTSRSQDEEKVYNASRLKGKDTFINISHLQDEDKLKTNLETYEEPVQELSTNIVDHKLGKEVVQDKDLLSEFIEEVKHYNINKGLRTVQDTQSNILNNLQKNEKVEKPDVVMELTTEIQQIIDDLEVQSFEDPQDKTKEVSIETLKPLDDAEDKVLSEMLDAIETNALEITEQVNAEIAKSEESSDTVPVTSFETNELLELTQTLSLKLDIQENELREVKEHNSFIDRVLTVIIAVLAISLVLIVVYGLWWVYKERGF